jgi:hypothetical protein
MGVDALRGLWQAGGCLEAADSHPPRELPTDLKGPAPAETRLPELRYV